MPGPRQVEALLKAAELSGERHPRELQAVMMDNVGVFRVEGQIRAALAKIGSCRSATGASVSTTRQAVQYRPTGGDRAGRLLDLAR